MLYFAETDMWADTSANFFSVAAFSNGVFWACPYYSQFGFVRCTNNLAKLLGLDLNFAN